MIKVIFYVQDKTTRQKSSTYPFYFPELNNNIAELIKNQIKTIENTDIKKTKKIFCLIENLEER